MNYTIPFAPPAGSFQPVPPAGPTRSTHSAYDDQAEKSLPLVFPSFSARFRHILTYNINMLWLNCRFADEIDTAISEVRLTEENYNDVCSRILAMERQISVIYSTAVRWYDAVDNLDEPYRTAEHRYKDRYYQDLCEEINELNDIEFEIDSSLTIYIYKCTLLSEADYFITRLKLCAESYANREPPVLVPTTEAPSLGPRQDCSDTANGKDTRATTSTIPYSPCQSQPIESLAKESHQCPAVSNELTPSRTASVRARISSDVRSYPERFPNQMPRSPSTTSSEDGLDGRSHSEPPIPSEFLDSPPLLLHGSIADQLTPLSKQSIDEHAGERRTREEITADDKDGESPKKNGIGECQEINGSKETLSPLIISVPSPDGEFIPSTDDHLLIPANLPMDLSPSNSEKTTDLPKDFTPTSTVSISDSLPSIALISGPSLPPASPIHQSIDDSKGEMREMEKIIHCDKDDTLEKERCTDENLMEEDRGTEEITLPLTVLTSAQADLPKMESNQYSPILEESLQEQAEPLLLDHFTDLLDPGDTAPIDSPVQAILLENALCRSFRAVSLTVQMGKVITPFVDTPSSPHYQETDERRMTHPRSSNDQGEGMRELALTDGRREENREGSIEKSTSHLRIDENTTSSFIAHELTRGSDSSELLSPQIPEENETHENKDPAHLPEEPSLPSPVPPAPCSSISLLADLQGAAISAEANEQFSASHTLSLPSLTVHRMKTEMSSSPLCVKREEEKKETRKEEKGREQVRSEIEGSETQQFQYPNTAPLDIDSQHSFVKFPDLQEVQNEDPTRNTRRGEYHRMTHPTEKNQEKEPPDSGWNAKEISREFHSLPTEEESIESPDHPLSSTMYPPPLSLPSNASTAQEGDERGTAILPGASLPQEDEPPDPSPASKESVQFPPSSETMSPILKSRRDTQEKPKFWYINRGFILTDYLWTVLFAVTLWLSAFLPLARLSRPGRARAQRDKREDSNLANDWSLISSLEGDKKAPDKSADLESEPDGENDEKPIKDREEARLSKCVNSAPPCDCPSPASTLHSTAYGEAPSAHQKRWSDDPGIQEHLPTVEIEGKEESLRELTSAHKDDSDHTWHRMALPPEKIEKWSLRLACDFRKESVDSRPGNIADQNGNQMTLSPEKVEKWSLRVAPVGWKKKREPEVTSEMLCSHIALEMNSRGKWSKICSGFEGLAPPKDSAPTIRRQDQGSSSSHRLLSRNYPWRSLILPRTSLPLASLLTQHSALSAQSAHCMRSGAQPGENLPLTLLLFEKGFKEPLEPPDQRSQSAGTGFKNLFFWYLCTKNTTSLQTTHHLHTRGVLSASQSGFAGDGHLPSSTFEFRVP